MINVLHSKYADQLKIRISDMQKETFEVEYEYAVSYTHLTLPTKIAV